MPLNCMSYLRFQCNNGVISSCGQQKELIFETELSDFLNIFLRLWPFEPRFSYNLFTYDLFTYNLFTYEKKCNYRSHREDRSSFIVPSFEKRIEDARNGVEEGGRSLLDAT